MSEYTMTREEIERLKELAGKATPGPWVGSIDKDPNGTKHFSLRYRPELAVCRTYGNSLAAQDDAAFIAASRQAVPALIEMVEWLTREHDEAQSACQAWQHVFEGIEAHLLDRINMRDEASPQTYLDIIRADVGRLLTSSKQICAARWADYSRHEARATLAERRAGELEAALKAKDAALAIAAGDVAALEAENRRLRECLEPFAKDAGNWADSVPDDYRPLCTEPGHTTAHPGSATAFTVGDLRRARDALEQS